MCLGQPLVLGGRQRQSGHRQQVGQLLGRAGAGDRRDHGRLGRAARPARRRRRSSRGAAAISSSAASTARRRARPGTARASSARSLSTVRARAVLAGQEAVGEREVRACTPSPSRTHRSASSPLVLGALDQVVVRAAARRSGRAPRASATASASASRWRGEVRRADVAHLAGARPARRTPPASPRSACRGRPRARSRGRCGRCPAGRSDSSAAARMVAGARPRRAGQLPDLGRDHDPVAVAARRHPVADDRLRLAAGAALDPPRVRVGRVEEVAAGVRVGVQHGERLRARRPSSRTRCRPGTAGRRRDPWRRSWASRPESYRRPILTGASESHTIVAGSRKVSYQ